MNDDISDLVKQLLDGWIFGALNVNDFDARLDELSARYPDLAARMLSAVEQRYCEGALAPDAFASLKARLAAFLEAGHPRIDSTGPSETRLRWRHGNVDSNVPLPGQPDNERRLDTPDPLCIDTVLAPGALIKGRFLLEEKIGEGGMGVVYKARDIRNEIYHEYVAIKFLRDQLQGRTDALQALQHEVRRAHELAHPNIVTVYEFDQDGALSFIYMELLEGQPLDSLLRSTGAAGLHFTEAWPIVQAAGIALAHAHENGTVHSDFKPANVFITRDKRVKVLDFGIARATRTDSTAFDSTVLGALTPAYASPEMVLNLEPDPRDDVYALACVAYELLAGRHPFDGMPAHRAQHAGLIPARIRGLSKSKHRALCKGLAFIRNERTPSVHAFLKELGQTTGQPRHLLRNGAAAVFVVAGAGWGVHLNFEAQACADIDSTFIKSLSATASATAQTIDPSYVPLLVEQGKDYLARAETSFDAALLSEGVSDAFGAFTSVLRIQPQSPEAETGIMRIIELYAKEARTALDARDADGALEIADLGLSIHSEHCELKSLRARAMALLK